MNLTLLSPYLESVGSDFRHGSNFACAASTVNQTATTFSLPVQVNQFNRFRARVADIFSQGIFFISNSFPVLHITILNHAFNIFLNFQF
jgi:hypothetical protein